MTQLLLTHEPQPDTTTDPISTSEPNSQISYHALMVHTIPQTLRLLGQIHNQPLTVLVDSGSTHNFIQDRVAKQLGLPLHPAQTFQFLVGNGAELQCTSMCRQVCLYLDTHPFLVDLFVLPLSGAELVLGVQWLKTLGPVLTDYEKLTMSFFREGQLIQLLGQPKPSPSEASLHQFQRLLSTHTVDTLLAFHPDQIHIVPQTTPETANPELQKLLSDYNNLFTSPSTLPPQRPTNHRIPLQTNTNPVNVRPYLYQHFQKQEIESQIQDMLTQGIIQPSSSAFSSPVLLV
jgi:hypothetical protein